MLDEQEEADLRWALCWAEGEMGLRSNFTSIVAALELGVAFIEGGSVRNDLNERALFAAQRERRVRRTLEVLTDGQQRVLRAAFGPYQFRLPCLGKVTMVAPLTRLARQHADGLDVLLWLSQLDLRVKGGEVPAATLARQVRTEAEWRLTLASQAYQAATRRR